MGSPVGLRQPLCQASVGLLAVAGARIEHGVPDGFHVRPYPKYSFH